jgi:type II secretory pathway component GspD/PulD (secretin)
MVRFLQILAVCAAAGALVSASSDLADRYYKAAEKAERGGDIQHAYLLYTRAAALDPKNPEFAAKKNALRTIAALSTRAELAPDPAESVPPPVPSVSGEDLRTALPPPRLVGSKEKKSFDLRGDPRNVIEKVGEAFGIQVVFESDYQTPPPFRFQMSDVEMDEAFHALEAVSNSFFVPVNAKLALVLRDTPQKRTERTPMMTVAVPIPQRMSVQEAQELLTAVQQTMEIRHISVDPGRRMVFLRDQATKAEIARQMFFDISQIRPQVEVDVEFLSVDRNSSLTYGISLPNQIPIVNFMGAMPLPQAFQVIRRLTGAATPFGLGITQATVFATLAKSRSDNILDAQVVALDGQATTLHVGQRYPIVTNTYVGNTAGANQSQIFAPAPTVNFEDLGLVLKVTPWIHEGGEVTLDVETEFKTLGAPSGVNGIPIVANRKFTGKVRLREGEWGVLAGLIQITDSDSRQGWPFLSDLPWIGRLFSQNTKEKDSSQVLLVLKPHLTTLPPWESAQHSIWVGTETRPITVY